MHSDVCNLLVYSLTVTSDQIINKHTVHHPKTDNTLFKITTRGLLIKMLKVLSIPSVRYNFSLFRLEFVIARSDYTGHDIGDFPTEP